MKHLVLYLSLFFSLTGFNAFSQNWAQVTTGAAGTDGCKGGQIYAILTYDSVLYAAGTFTTCNGSTLTACNHIAQWNGTVWKPVGTSPNDGVTGTIYAMAIFNGKLIVAGNITKCAGATIACNNIAQWNGTTWSVCGAAAGDDGVKGGTPVINALTVYNGHLVAGGDFTQCNGSTGTLCNNIARWDGTNGAASWSVCGAAHPNDGTQSGFAIAGLTVLGTKLVAGGAFNFCNGGNTACFNIAQWDGTNGATSWSVCGFPGKDGINFAGTTVIAFTTYGAHLIVGGTFHGAVCNGGTTTCNYVAQWDGTGTITSWTPLTVGLAEGVGPVAGANAVYSLNVASGALFIGGQFTTAAGVVANVNNVVYWNGTSFSGMGPTVLKYGTSATVYASAIYSGLLYAGGTISTCNNATTTCNEIASFTGGVLPIELGHFDAVYSPQNKVVNLSWSTYTETNNAFFTVQRTADGVNYEDIATVAGAGNSDVTLNYTSVDEQPLLGTSYYRLKQTDFDGHYTYSSLQPINIESNYSVNIFPNPVSETLSLNVYTQVSSNIEIRIFNLLGQVISDYTVNVPVGNSTYPVNVSNLSSGLYFIQCNTPEKTFTNKFVKQ
jgi:hypothetical protein